MKTRITFVTAITITALMLFSTVPHFNTGADPINTPSVQHSSNVVVNFNGGRLPADYANVISSAGGQVIKAIPEIGVVDAKPSSVSGDTFLANIRASFEVYQAGSDIIANLIMPQSITTDEDATPPSIPPPPTTILGAPARDRYYIEANGNVPSNQWAVRRVGGFGVCPTCYGPAGGAWDTTIGSSSVTIAIVDTGISPLHPDVNAKIIDAQSSIFGTTPTPLVGSDPSVDDGSPDDQVGHGTWTASLAAGGLDPVGGIGATVGVAPGVNLANLKVLVRTTSGGGSGEFAWTVAAIVYAANHGYQIISMSLGGFADRTNRDDVAIYTALIRASNYAFSHGSILFAAAGNSGLNLDKIGSFIELPGMLPNVIAFTATTNPACVENLAPGATCSSGPDGLAFYSDYGSSLNALAAPGGSLPAGGAIGKTGFVRGACSPGKATTNSLCFTLGHVYYVRAIGTSASTPLVAGAAALVLSANPNLSPSQVRAVLDQTATNIGPRMFFGYGLVNAAAAVQLAPNFGGSGSADICTECHH